MAASRAVTQPGPPEQPRSAVSRWLSQVDQRSSRPAAVTLVLAAVAVWLGVSIAAGFPARWETIFQTLVAALTLAMVFVIQHTQARHQRATQRKLDEIVLALPGADNVLVTLEHASDAQMHATGQQHRQIRQAVLDDKAAGGDGDSCPPSGSGHPRAGG